MKSIERRREDFANLLNDENRESIIEEMYETGEIYDRADNIDIEKEYQNFKKMVNKQIQKRKSNGIELLENVIKSNEKKQFYYKRSWKSD